MNLLRSYFKNNVKLCHKMGVFGSTPLVTKSIIVAIYSYSSCLCSIDSHDDRQPVLPSEKTF